MKRFIIILLALMAVAPKAFSYDVAVVAPSGQTLYYELKSDNTAYVVSPAAGNDSNYVTGDLIIPDTIFCNGVAYPVVEIWHFAFRGCRGLTSVVIGNRIRCIRNNAFFCCFNLRSVSIPNSVKRIESAAFASCHSLDSVVVPNLTTKRIEASTFSGCHSLSSITIPDEITRIEEQAFQYCDSLRTIDLPDSLTYIGDRAFLRCDNLSALTIPELVSYIGSGAFNCNSLHTIWLKPTTPPMGMSYQFPMFSNLIVPHNSYNDYIAWQGTQMYTIYSDTIFLSTNGAKSVGGHVVGADDTMYAYPYDDTIRLEAVADPGYEFVNWEDGSTNPVRLLIGLRHDTTLFANFVHPSGIDDISDDDIQVSTVRGGNLLVSGADEEVVVYDIAGCRIARAKGNNLNIRVPQSGIYFLKIGSLPARKMVIIQ